MGNEVKKKKRIFYLDELRALAIILVILAHVTRKFCENYTVGDANWIASAPLISIAVLGVPIFLMISGVLLLNREYELGDFLKRRFSRILIPFIFWAALLPIHKMIFINQPATIQNYIQLFLVGQYWFVYMLIGVYLALPILNTFIQKYKLKGVEYFLIMWFIVLILNTFNKYPFASFRLEYFAGFLGYLPLGYYLANKDFKISDKYLIIIGLLMCIIGIYINWHSILVKWPITGKISYYGYETIVTVLGASGLFIAVKSYVSMCDKNIKSIPGKIHSFIEHSFIGKAILSVSICSYGMFLIHYFWQFIFVWMGRNMFPIFQRDPTFALPIMLIVISFLSWLVTYVLSKIPYLKEISGAH